MRKPTKAERPEPTPEVIIRNAQRRAGMLGADLVTLDCLVAGLEEKVARLEAEVAVLRSKRQSSKNVA